MAVSIKQGLDLLIHRRDELINSFLRNQAPDFLMQYTMIIDEYFRSAFEMNEIGSGKRLIENPYALIALGGYGRQEECIKSDIDLLFLFKYEVPEYADRLVEQIVYPLWDAAFEVGHATRSLKDSLSAARDNYEILTSMLDARFLCGSSLLLSDLFNLLRKKLFVNRKKQVVEWLIGTNRKRHNRFGDSGCLLEPNLKEGRGGLRDYHTMLWIGRILFGTNRIEDLEHLGYISTAEKDELLEALSFIFKVRNRLHWITQRKCDQLYFNHQPKLAEDMGFIGTDGQKPVERFLGRLHKHMRLINHCYNIFISEIRPAKKRKPSRRELKTGLHSSRGLIFFSSPEAILKDPGLLMDIFSESLKANMPPSAEAVRLVRDFRHLVDRDFMCDQKNRRTFEKILSSPSFDFDPLDFMLESGLLTAYIPEFSKLENRIQYNEYHIYSVDRHTLKTLKLLKELTIKGSENFDPFCASLFKHLRKRHRIFWAALLHDIGKGFSSRDHAQKGSEIAFRIMLRAGYSPMDADAIAFLVRHHLLLIKTATRRDLNDEETALYCARIIRKKSRLKMLYLLTIADSMATGPKAWNEWSAVLLTELFLKVHNILEKGGLAGQRATSVIESKRSDLAKHARMSDDPEKFMKAASMMSPRYLLAMPVKKILAHLDLFFTLGEEQHFVWRITASKNRETRKVTLCAHDRPGIFSKIAGVFTLNRINILDASIFTWKNNIALDIFEVTPPIDPIFEADMWKKVEKDLKSALKEELDINKALKMNSSGMKSASKTADQPISGRVVIDNETSSFFTIIEVFTYDFQGLLFFITDMLFRQGLDIWVAKIATKVDQVVDVFYVRDTLGNKITENKRLEEIKDAILSVI